MIWPERVGRGTPDPPSRAGCPGAEASQPDRGRPHWPVPPLPRRRETRGSPSWPVPATGCPIRDYQPLARSRALVGSPPKSAETAWPGRATAAHEAEWGPVHATPERIADRYEAVDTIGIGGTRRLRRGYGRRGYGTVHEPPVARTGAPGHRRVSWPADPGPFLAPAGIA